MSKKKVFGSLGNLRDHPVTYVKLEGLFAVSENFLKIVGGAGRKVYLFFEVTYSHLGLIVIFGVFGFFAFHDWLWKNSYREKTEFFPYKNEKN